MNEMFERINNRCIELGTLPGVVCNKLGIRRGLMTDLKNNPGRYLSAENVLKLARELRVSCDYLISGEDSHFDATSDDRKLLDAYSRATDAEKENVRFILRAYLSKPEEKEAAK